MQKTTLQKNGSSDVLNKEKSKLRFLKMYGNNWANDIFKISYIQEMALIAKRKATIDLHNSVLPRMYSATLLIVIFSPTAFVIKLFIFFFYSTVIIENALDFEKSIKSIRKI